ncbi:MAG: hypothetical protein JWM85_2712 [Acidimicrobiaceae bacterium]|nr:hypothetical protein [Acidimicrobiaceae bacterium]
MQPTSQDRVQGTGGLLKRQWGPGGWALLSLFWLSVLVVCLVEGKHDFILMSALFAGVGAIRAGMALRKKFGAETLTKQ